MSKLSFLTYQRITIILLGISNEKGLSVLLLYLPGINTPMDDTYTHLDFYNRLVLIQKKYLFRKTKNKEPLSRNMIFFI